MCFIGSALEFRVILDTYMKGSLSKLYCFDQSSVRRSAAERKACFLEGFTVIVIEFIAVSVSFTDIYRAVHGSGAVSK